MKTRNQRFVELVKVYAMSSKGSTFFNSKAEPCCVNSELIVKAVSYSLDVKGPLVILSNDNQDLYKDAILFSKWVFTNFNKEHSPEWGDTQLAFWRKRDGQVSS